MKRLYDKLFPELERFPTEESRKNAYRSIDLFNGIGGMVLLMVQAAVIVAVSEFICDFFALPEYANILGAGFAGGISSLTLIFWFRTKIRRSLRMQLRKLGVPICLGCSYDLRADCTGRCPECGRPTELPSADNSHAK